MQFLLHIHHPSKKITFWITNKKLLFISILQYYFSNKKSDYHKNYKFTISQTLTCNSRDIRREGKKGWIFPWMLTGKAKSAFWSSYNILYEEWKMFSKMRQYVFTYWNITVIYSKSVVLSLKTKNLHRPFM